MKNETARREIELLDYYLQNHTNDYSEKSHTAMMMAIEALEQKPIVRCKDCIHRYVTGDVTNYYVCDFMDAQYEDDGYCHHGERREP